MMENEGKKAYKPRASKMPGGDDVSIKDESQPHQPMILREPVKQPPLPVQFPRWVLTEHGWEQQ